MNTYTEVDSNMEDTAPPTQYVSYFAATVTGNTETSESQRGEPEIVYLPPDSSDVYEEEVYLELNPSSSSAGAAFQSVYCEEPEPEPPADFGTDTEQISIIIIFSIIILILIHFLESHRVHSLFCSASSFCR